MKRVSRYLITAVGLMTIGGAPAVFARGFNDSANRFTTPERRETRVETRVDRVTQRVTQRLTQYDRFNRDRDGQRDVRDRRDFRLNDSRRPADRYDDDRYDRR